MQNYAQGVTDELVRENIMRSLNYLMASRYLALARSLAMSSVLLFSLASFLSWSPDGSLSSGLRLLILSSGIRLLMILSSGLRLLMILSSLGTEDRLKLE